MEQKRGKRKVFLGTVISDKMDKTRVVQVKWASKHRKYVKSVSHGQKYKAHDEKNASVEGNVVKIRETRPLSKDKRWIITEIVKTS